MKKILCFVMAVLLAFPLAACTDDNHDSSSGSGDKKPSTIVDQDLSMFDTVKHYGIEQVETYKLSIVGDNATFLSGGKTAKAVAGAQLPEIKLNNENEYISGIRYVKTGKEIKKFRFRMPEEDCEIEVLTTSEKPAYFAQLNVATDFNGKEGYDFNSAAKLWVGWQQTESTFKADSPFTMNREYSIEIDKKNVDINGNSDEDFLSGVVLKLNGVAGNAARMLTGCGASGSEEGIVAGETYTFTYNFENFGDKEVAFRAYQGQTGVKLTGAVAVNAGKDIVLKPGESASYKIIFTAVNANTNIIPILELRSDFDDTLLGMAISKENAYEECKHETEKIPAKDGDCGYAGNIEYYGCTLCGGTWSDDSCENAVSINEVSIKKDHDTKGGYEGITPTEHSIVCSVCHGGIAYEEHKYHYDTVKEPTETEKGIKEEVCDCGHKSGKTVEFEAANKLTVVTNTERKEFELELGERLPEEAKTLLGGGFYNVDNHSEIYTLEGFSMPEYSLTVKPLSVPLGTVLDFGSAFGTMDMFGGSATYENLRDSGVMTKTFGVVKGKEVTINHTSTDFQPRFKSSYGSNKSVGGFTYYITVENRSGVDVNLRVAQVNGGANLIEGAYSDFVTLKVGESMDFVFTFPDDASLTNANALTMFTFKGVPTDKPVVLGVSVSYKEKE